MMSIKNINKTTISSLFFVCVLMLAIFSANAVSAEQCKNYVCATVTFAGGHGEPATAVIRNSSGFDATVVFESYKMFIPFGQTGWLKTQEKFDSKEVFVKNSSTVNVSVATPGCLSQVDVYMAPGYDFFWDDNPSSYPLGIVGAGSHDDNVCTKCTDECSDSQKVCDGNGWKQCMKGADGCNKWSGTTQCDANQTCASGSCVTTCQPSTCNMLHYQCGTVSDGCGGTLNCGTCQGNQTCSASGQCITTCQPKTCANLGYQCGTISDGCGGTLNCGTCQGNQTCSNGSCVTNCQNQCQLGDKRCSGSGYQVCGNYNGDGCAVWGQIVNCGANQFCQDGNCNQPKQNLNVNLFGQSGCAPLDGVALHATVNGNNYDYNNNSNNYQNQYTYYFDCNSDGSWDKTVTTGQTDVIVNGLCDYENPGNYTARVKVESNGATAFASTTIEAQNCQHYQPVIVPIAPVVQNLQIQKTVADLSNGTNYQPAVTASPGDIISFRISVGTNSGCNQVFVNDIVPAGIENLRDLRVDGQPVGGDIASGIAIGDLASGQTRIITFTATVDGPGYFPFGQTTLINTAAARNSQLANSSSASVYVWRQAVLGATRVSTGITDSPWFEYLIAAISGLLISSILFRKEIAAFIRKPIAGDKKRRESSKAELRNVILKLRAK